jgi:PAS domain S-box-containing protein
MNRIGVTLGTTPDTRLPKRRLPSSTVIELSSYVYETLRADEELILSRARGDGEVSTILVVAPVSEYPTLGSLARLEHEYSLRDELDSDWAARPLVLTQREGRTMLVLEDPGGEPLDWFLGQSMELGRFLRLAINLAAGLGKLHQRGLIHKDIKPANILVDSATHKAWFTGFGIASRLPRECQAAEPPEVIAGTLAYMAPEQTGRMNRSIDSRSDLYSLGVTLYEMLTGALPFHASNPSEWVHCHIARRPPKPGEQTERVPEPISAAILKLLAKTAEERYQTAAGLEADLRKCLREWESLGRIDSFRLAEHDVPDRLLIPEKLYGRSAERQILLDAFDRVVGSGRPEFVLVSGYSGIGKSSVVHELHKAIVLPRGIFISGKFDQNKRDVPYATLAQAFQTLVRQILSKSEEEVIHWRNAILEALGPNGQLMVDLVPELELVIGKQPPVPELPPQETQNRFEAMLRGFLGVFARQEHPLALFLDDLQWLDPATLKLLEQFVTHPDIRYLLLIGAYRDNEVTAYHPLMLTLGAIRKDEAIVHEIALKPLSLKDVNQLLADALRCEPAHTRPLAELVHEKTEGNPFFTIQFLTTLAEEHLLEFEAWEAAWRWDVNRIRAMGFTDNVVDLVLGKLTRLPVITQKALRQLACLGNSVEITTLSMVHGGSEEDLHADFLEAVRGGFVLRLADYYKFLHDRVREAAYALIPEEQQAEAHVRIGRTMIAKMTSDEIAKKIFDIVNQLNSGLALIVDPEEKERVAELNFNAGKKAKASAAYASACTYFSLGTALLGDGGWETRYELAFGLRLERAECEFLGANFAEAERLISQLLCRAKSKIDRAAAYRLKIRLHMMQSDNLQAIRSGLECLRMFGIEKPAQPTRDEVQIEYDKVWVNLGERSIESLIDLPLMTNPEMHTLMGVLSVLSIAAYLIDTNLTQLLACQMVNVSLKYGTTDASAHGYAGLGLFLGPVFHRYDDGDRFARLAIQLVEEHQFSAWKSDVYLLAQMVVLWTQPIKTAIGFLQTAFRAAVETGDVVFACYSLEHTVTDLLARGDNLDQLWLESVKGLDFAQKAKFRQVVEIITSTQLFIQNMRGQKAGFSISDGAKVDEQRLEPAEGRPPVVVCFDWILKLRACFMAGQYEAAIVAAEKAKPLLWASQCHIQTVDYHYYGALAVAAINQTAEPERQAKRLETLKQHLEPLAEWAKSCPETFLDKFTLVSAELARIEGRDLEAMRLYEEAIRAAHAHGFVQNEAIGNEVTARFYLDRGYETIADAYLRNARFCYFRWGALGKVQQLDLRYPAIAGQASPHPTSTIGTPVEQLDLGTVMKASQAVSSEIVLEKLIETLMLIAVEHAGAERGLLILQRGEEYRIEAVARTGRDGVEVQLRQAATTPAELPESLLRYVIRTQQSVILDDASSQSLFSEDPYVLRKCPRSLLCLPLVKQTKLVGALYLENNLAPRVFTPKRLAMLELLASQAAISLDHARLYADLTEENRDRRKAEEALRASEERLQHIVDNTTAVIFVKDLELRYLLVNREFEQRHQVRRDQIRGKTDFDIHPPEVAEAVRANDRRVIQAGEPIQFEEAAPSVEGERRYVAVKFLLRDRTGKPYAVCGIATDVTESKRTEEMQAAMAREREMFAQQRATQLAKANEALRGSLDALASVPELDEFIGQVMAAITRQLGAVSSMLRLLDAEQKSMTLDLLFQDDRVMSPDEAKYPEHLRSSSLDELGFASLEDPVTVLHLADPRALMMPNGLRGYLLGLGIKTLLIIPLTSRGQANGVLSFRFTEERDFQTEELEISRALATQASLAIQLTQLAKTARQSAVLAERNRLAGEIHDSLAQSFAGISMQLSAAAGAMRRKSKDSLSHVERATDLARFGLSEARRSALSLRSNVIEESGLIEALRMLVQRSNIPGLLHCTFRSSRVREECLAPQVQQDLLRIAQEAISNALRHAQPTVIGVSLRWDPPNLVLKIRDNGSGIVGGRPISGGEGFGFANMRARAKNLGAELHIRSSAGTGTSVVVRLPID